jgi:SAM-dependent methyltransferase
VKCCAPKGAEPFTEKVARRDAQRFRKKGLDDTALQLAAAVDPAGATVLEIGGGVGGLHLELLRRGASRATNIELSPAYESVARELARELKLDERIERRVLDFAATGNEIGDADLVLMHRVVCCSPDVDALVGTAAAHARRTLALSFPRDTWWTNLGRVALNTFARLARWSWRFYVHPPARIVAAAERGGLRLVQDRRGLIWQIASLERAPASAGAP